MIMPFQGYIFHRTEVLYIEDKCRNDAFIRPDTLNSNTPNNVLAAMIAAEAAANLRPDVLSHAGPLILVGMRLCSMRPIEYLFVI